MDQNTLILGIVGEVLVVVFLVGMTIYIRKHS